MAEDTPSGGGDSLLDFFVDIRTRGVEAAKRGIDSILPSAQKFNHALEDIGSVGRRAFAGIAVAVGLVTKAAADAEQSTMKLRSALRANGEEVNNNVARFNAFAQGMQDISGISKDSLKDFAAFATNLGVTADQLENVTKAGIGLGTSVFGGDTEQGVRAVTMAMNGNTRELDRLIPGLRNYASAQDKLNVIQEYGRRGFQETLENTKTFSGSMQNLRNHVTDAGEKIGEAFIPALNSVAQIVANVTDRVSNLSDAQKASLVNWTEIAAVAAVGAVALGVLGSAVSTTATLFGATTAVVGVAGTALKAFVGIGAAVAGGFVSVGGVVLEAIGGIAAGLAALAASPVALVVGSLGVLATAFAYAAGDGDKATDRIGSGFGKMYKTVAGWVGSTITELGKLWDYIKDIGKYFESFENDFSTRVAKVVIKGEALVTGEDPAETQRKLDYVDKQSRQNDAQITRQAVADVQNPNASGTTTTTAAPSQTPSTGGNEFDGLRDKLLSAVGSGSSAFDRIKDKLAEVGTAGERGFTALQDKIRSVADFFNVKSSTTEQNEKTTEEVEHKSVADATADVKVAYSEYQAAMAAARRTDDRISNPQSRQAQADVKDARQQWEHAKAELREAHATPRREQRQTSTPMRTGGVPMPTQGSTRLEQSVQRQLDAATDRRQKAQIQWEMAPNDANKFHAFQSAKSNEYEITRRLGNYRTMLGAMFTPEQRAAADHNSISDYRKTHPEAFISANKDDHAHGMKYEAGRVELSDAIKTGDGQYRINSRGMNGMSGVVDSEAYQRILTRAVESQRERHRGGMATVDQLSYWRANALPRPTTPPQRREGPQERSAGTRPTQTPTPAAPMRQTTAQAAPVRQQGPTPRVQNATPPVPPPSAPTRPTTTPQPQTPPKEQGFSLSGLFSGGLSGIGDKIAGVINSTGADILKRLGISTAAPTPSKNDKDAAAPATPLRMNRFAGDMGRPVFTSLEDNFKRMSAMQIVGGLRPQGQPQAHQAAAVTQGQLATIITLLKAGNKEAKEGNKSSPLKG